MKIAIGSDHGGYALKMELIPVIEKLGFEVADFGCPDEKSVDYPDVAFPVAEAVAMVNMRAASSYAARASAFPSARTRCAASAVRSARMKPWLA